MFTNYSKYNFIYNYLTSSYTFVPYNLYYTVDMAKPIKDTPTLKGKDARKFLKQFSKAETSKVPAEQIAKMREQFSKLHSIAKF